jgi:hypothetical protein
MLITKDNPVGIDAKIQQLQTKLHDDLLAKWGIVTDQYKCLGRCYRNRKDQGYVAELYLGNGEYKDAYWDDTISAISFFGLSNSPVKHNLLEQANVHLVFFVNLAKLKTGIAHRADEEVRIDVLDLIGNSLFGFVFQSIELGLDSVLKEYPASWRTAEKYTNLKTVDMHPLHCFRLNLFVQYDKNFCTNPKIK